MLVGPNGCGKSTLIDAISLALGRTRMVRSLTEHDFSGSDPAAATRIKILVTIAGFASDDPEEHDTWFPSDRAVPKWLGTDGQEYAEASADRKLCANVGFCARFDRDELEVVSGRYFHDDDDASDPFDDEGGLVQVPARLLNDLGFFVLPARRDWDAVASFNSDLFRRTVSNLAGIPADEILNQRNALRNPEIKIEDSDKLTTLVTGLNERLARLAPNAPRFQLRVTAGDSEAVLQSLLPHYARDGGPSLPAARHGSGLVSLQSLLLLLEVGRARIARETLNKTAFEKNACFSVGPKIFAGFFKTAFRLESGFGVAWGVVRGCSCARLVSWVRLRCLADAQQMLLGDDQVRQRKEGVQLRRVLLHPAVAHLAMLEEVLHDMERMLDQCARPGLELLKAQRQILHPALGHLLDLAALGGDAPLHPAVCGDDLCALLHAEVAGVDMHGLFLSMQQGVRLADV